MSVIVFAIELHILSAGLGLFSAMLILCSLVLYCISAGFLLFSIIVSAGFLLFSIIVSAGFLIFSVVSVLFCVCYFVFYFFWLFSIVSVLVLCYFKLLCQCWFCAILCTYCKCCFFSGAGFVLFNFILVRWFCLTLIFPKST